MSEILAQLSQSYKIDIDEDKDQAWLRYTGSMPLGKKHHELEWLKYETLLVAAHKDRQISDTMLSPRFMGRTETMDARSHAQTNVTVSSPTFEAKHARIRGIQAAKKITHGLHFVWQCQYMGLADLETIL